MQGQRGNFPAINRHTPVCGGRGGGEEDGVLGYHCLMPKQYNKIQKYSIVLYLSMTGIAAQLLSW